MNWYYVDQGKQAGPVDELQLARLSAEGRIQEATLVWHEGMANWQPFRDVKGSFTPAQAPPLIAPMTSTPAAAVAVAATAAVCVECRNVFPKENMIHYGNLWVCAGCKPIFMQKVAEGVTTGSAGGPGTATEADLLARDYDVDIGDSISKGWENFKGNAGILIGASVIAYVIIFVVAMIGNLANMVIPFIGLVINMLISPPLRAGLWLTFVKSTRGGPGELNDLFKAFGPRYWQTVLVAVVPAILVLGVMFVFGLFAVLAIPHYVPPRNSAIPHPASLPAGAFIPIAILFFVVMLAWLYILTCWLFSMPLVIDKGLRFWPAMELSRRVVVKHWWATFGLMIIAGLLFLAGAFACGVGMLVTGPVAFGALSAHYEKVFGDLAPQA